jgi:hypothetical protein
MTAFRFQVVGVGVIGEGYAECRNEVKDQKRLNLV